MSKLDAHYEARFQRDAEDIARHEPWYLDEQRGPGRAAIFGGYDGGERRVIADMVLLTDARRIVADHNSARAASEREQRMREALKEIADFRMIGDHDGYDDAYKMRDIAIDALAALSETGPAGPVRGADDGR